MTAEQGSTYKTYMYKRTYVPRARKRRRSGIAVGELAALPKQCPGRSAKDVRAALRRPPQHRQEVLDELQARSQSGTVRNVVAYFFALVKRVFAGEFRLWAGRKVMSATPRPAENRPTGAPRTEDRPKPTAQPASRETALAHIANIRKMLNASTNAGDLAAQAMQTRDGSRTLRSKCCRKTRVVTARRSDDPRNTANNAGESQFLLRAAYMMMAALN